MKHQIYFVLGTDLSIIVEVNMNTPEQLINKMSIYPSSQIDPTKHPTQDFCNPQTVRYKGYASILVDHLSLGVSVPILKGILIAL